MFTRQDFIKALAAAGVVLLNPFRRLGSWAVPEMASAEEAVGELYAGFVLLPEGAEIPYFVNYPKTGPPNPCGIGVEKDGIVSNSATRFFDTAEDLAKAVEFPVYTLDKLPKDVQFASVFIECLNSGAIYTTCLGFEVLNPDNGYKECVISLWAQPDFFRPYPLWFEAPVEEGDLGTVLQKVSILQMPGIKITTQEGYVCYWIKDDILYSLIVEPAIDKSFQATDSLALVKN